MKIRRKRETGITLIALVISIIVLLILAGVAIAALSGDNGILTRAKEAKEKTEQAQKDEKETLSNMENMLGVYNFKNINPADTNPAGAMPSDIEVLENNANKGIVIKDKNENEWVWIEVPKTTVFSGLTIDTTKELTEQDYNDIRDKLIDYAATYREGALGQGYNWIDEWYDDCGMTSEEYIAAYQKMLKSVYTYGGFWIGRYEAGIKGSIEDATKYRTTASERIVIGTSPKAIIKKDAIPYNNIYCNEAQALANEITPDNDYKSSLLFGIQWDLVCKFLEAKSELTSTDINSDSSKWGIYKDIIRTITSENAKQAGNLWTKITEIKPADIILLTTGASDETKKMNIYDLAGNEWEWTLEHATSDIKYPCAYRGGGYYCIGSSYPASYRFNYSTSYSDNSFSFRVTLY